MKIDKWYLLLFLLLFAVEAVIALYFKGNFIRAHLGDFFIVMMVYAFLRSTTRLSVPITALFVLLIAFSFETAQYFHLLEYLGWEESKAAHLVFGKKFDPIDLLMYTAGILVTLCLEYFVPKPFIGKKIRGRN